MDSIKDLLKDNKKAAEKFQDKHKYVTKEYQDYGYRIAKKLGAPDRQISLFIKLAKEKPRGLLERSFSFTIDYPNAKNKVKIFMWKLKELEDEYKSKKKEEEDKQLSLLDSE